MSDQWIAYRNKALVAIAAIIGLGVVALTGYSLAYAGKIYAGVTIDGVPVGGLSVADAQKKLADAALSYNSALLPVQYGDTTVRIPVGQLGVKYQPDAAEQAVLYGRTGNLLDQTHARLRALFGRPTAYFSYKFDNSKLQLFLDQISDDVTAPVANAALSFDGGNVSVSDAQPGKRLDRGTLTLAIKNQLATMSSNNITAPVYDMPAAISRASLDAAKSQADRYVSEPITLKVNGQTKSVDIATITSWIKVGEAKAPTEIDGLGLGDFYHTDAPVDVALTVDRSKVQAFVADLAKSVDQEGQNAALTIQDGKAVVFQPSRNGISLDQSSAIDAIIATVNKAPGDRTANLITKIIKPTINEENLNNLGIKELISEGETFFPGSPSTRLTNIRVGAAKFNGVLVAPGDTFSFGQILGDVGPAQGYVPELVILGDHEEKQYGGGLCQVASTAYRAALLAGVPIVERHNHSFAVSYYTAPYGVPGVDATIYYPEVDFKFKNDTPGYILIQTVMQGTTLKFDFYGTKTKSGVIRGPQFISGTTDATQPSHTIFWRDVVDLSGNVIKTDTVETWYKSSKDFPINTQFN